MPRSHEAVSRLKAEKLIDQYTELHGKLLKLSDKLRDLRPHSRQAYFQYLAPTAEDAATIARVWVKCRNVYLDESECAAFGVGVNLSYFELLPHLEEYVASRGWSDEVRKLIAEMSHRPEAPEAPETVAYA